MDRQQRRYLLLGIFWLVYVILALFSIKCFFGDFYIPHSPTFILSAYSNMIFYIYLISLPLTILVACEGRIRSIKENKTKVITLLLLKTFGFYTFYQYLWAYHGAANISYETVYSFNE